MSSGVGSATRVLRPAIPRRVGATTGSAVATLGPALKFGAASWLLFKLASLVVGMVSVYGAAFPRQLLAHPRTALLRIWDHWDSNWYLSLARDGYVRWEHVLIPPGHYQDGVAFAPGLPLATRLVSVVSHVDALTASMLVVAVSLFIGLVGIYRLAELDFGPAVAGITVVLLLVFPSSAFYNAPYAEALVLAGSVWGVLLVRMGHVPLGALVASVAILSKIASAIVLLLMAAEILRPRLATQGAWRHPRTYFPLALLAIGVVPLLGWMAYLQYRFHNAFGFLTSQKQWAHHASLPWQPAAASLAGVFNLTMFDQGHGLITFSDLVSLLVLVGLTVYLLVRVRWTYGVFCMIAILVLTTTGQMDSMTRHVLIAFPAFIGAAVILARRPWLERATIVLLAPAAVYFISRYATGQWAG